MNFKIDLKFKIHNLKFSRIFREKRGQLLVEMLVSIMVGTLFVVAATLAILAFLRYNFDSRSAATIALNNSDNIQFLEQISTRDWQAIASLVEGSSTPYFIVPNASSSFIVQGVESMYADNVSFGLAAHWKFDERATTTAYDNSGNMHTGTPSGSVTKVTSTELCEFQGCVSFTASGSGRIGITSAPDLSSTNDGTFSVSVWVKPTTLSSSWRRGIIVYESYLVSGYRLGFSNGGAPVFWTTESGGTLSVAGSQPLAVNAWNHLAVTYDSGQAYMYLNGTLIGSGTGTYIASAAQMRLGAAVSEYFDGSMDDVRVYNRELSADEVRKLYAGKVNQRYFWVADVYRDGAGALTLSSSGNTLDPAVQKVQAVTQTSEGRTVVYEEYIVRNLPRTYSQKDWTSGSGVTGPVTSTPLGFATSSNIVAGASLELAATSSAGSLESSTYDTQDINGAAVQSIFWRGALPGGAVVKFQLAGSNNSTGPWGFVGPDGTDTTYFTPSTQNVQVRVLNVNEYRYLRYKVFLTPGSSEGLRVDDIHFNWTP
jgi:hypothetical protein